MVVRVVEPVVGAAHVNIALHDPDKFFDGVVEVEFHFSAGATSGNGFFTGKLELFNQVFVRELSEAATFIGI